MHFFFLKIAIIQFESKKYLISLHSSSQRCICSFRKKNLIILQTLQTKDFNGRTLIQIYTKIRFFFSKIHGWNKEEIFLLPKKYINFALFGQMQSVCACSFVTHAHLIQLKSWLKLLPVKLSHNILVRFQLGWSGAR